MAWKSDSLIGFVPNPKAELFEVPASVDGHAVEHFLLKYLVLVNTDDASGVQATIFVNKNNVSVPVMFKGFNLQPHQDLQGNLVVPLQPGDKIEGEATEADKVSYVLGYAMRVAD